MSKLRDDDDRNQIALMAESCQAFSSDEEARRYEPRMRRQTRRLIHKHRDKIERVAKGPLLLSYRGASRRRDRA